MDCRDAPSPARRAAGDPGAGARRAAPRPVPGRGARRRLAAALLAGLAAAGGTRAAAPQDPATAAQPTGQSAPSAPRLFAPSVSYGGTAFANLRGGAERGGTYSGLLNLGLYVDGNALPGWDGTLGYVDLSWIHGGQPSEWVGDAQGVSNISAPAALRVYEAWVQKNAPGNRFSALAGLYDLNSEFYNVQAATLFLNSSFGIGPAFSQSGRAGPSLYPRTAFAARVAFKPTPSTVLRAALANGVPFERDDGSHALHRSGDGALLVAEYAVLDRPDLAERPPRRRQFRIGRSPSPPGYDDKLAVGGWYYTATFDDLSERAADGTPLRRRGSGGVYLAAQKLLHDAGGRRVSAFAQGGAGDGRTNRFGSYLGAGLVATGWVRPGTPDELGLAVAVARNGAHYLDAQRRQGEPATRAETAFELSYLIPVSDRFAIQPDLQYVVHPNTDPRLANSLSFQLRFEIAF